MELHRRYKQLETLAVLWAFSDSFPTVVRIPQVAVTGGGGESPPPSCTAFDDTEKTDMHPRVEWNSIPEPLCFSGHEPCISPRGHYDRQETRINTKKIFSPTTGLSACRVMYLMVCFTSLDGGPIYQTVQDNTKQTLCTYSHALK